MFLPRFFYECFLITLQLNIEYRIFFRLFAIEYSKYIDTLNKDKKATFSLKQREILASIPFHYLGIYLAEIICATNAQTERKTKARP